MKALSVTVNTAQIDQFMFLFSTDIDGTVYDGPETAKEFASFWGNLKESENPPILAYNTGRALDDAKNLIATTDLPEPDYLICGVGTEMFDWNNGSQLSAWHESLSEGWSFEKVVEIVLATAQEIEMQPEACQNPHKCSWYWHNKNDSDLEALRNALAAAGLNAQVVYSSRKDLDILPNGANKGNAVSWLWTWLDRQSLPIIVAGDSGNDSSMFQVAGVNGILVSNAEEALCNAVPSDSSYFASSPCAYGVVEGLAHFSQAHSPEATDTPAEDVV